MMFEARRPSRCRRRDSASHDPTLPSLALATATFASWITLGVICFAPLPAGAAVQQDNRGTEFILGFAQNAGQPDYLALFITGDIATTGMVEIPNLEFSQAFTVVPGTITPVSLPTQAAAVGSNVTGMSGIHVTANAEIVVFGLNQELYTTDAFLGLPTDILGKEHIVLAFGQTAAASEFLIVGVQDNTSVTITPSITTGARSAGVPYTITLNRLGTYQLQSDGANEDLSGSIIQSNQPVAVFGGNQCAYVPNEIPYCDHLIEQLPPTTTWGASFLTVPLATRTAGDLFRIIARDAGTEVRIDGTLVATLARAAFHQADLASGTFHTIEASGPVMVMQYSKGTAADSVTSDPFMMMIPPSQQFQPSYTLTTPASEPVTFNNFVNVVVETADTGSCTIDGGPFTAAFAAIGASGFSGAQQPVAVGSHVLACPHPFGAYSYGFADFDSYGYPGGLALENIAETRVVLTPALAFSPPGVNHSVTARVTVNVVDPVPGRDVTFNVLAGPNAGDSGTSTTNASGEAGFTYAGDGGVGVDQIVASVFDDQEQLVESGTALEFWDADCNGNAIPDACDLSCAGFGGLCEAYAGCGAGLACVTPTPTPTATPIATPTATPTIVPTATPTPAPTPTPTPEPPGAQPYGLVWIYHSEADDGTPGCFPSTPPCGISGGPGDQINLWIDGGTVSSSEIVCELGEGGGTGDEVCGADLLVEMTNGHFTAIEPVIDTLVCSPSCSDCGDGICNLPNGTTSIRMNFRRGSGAPTADPRKVATLIADSSGDSLASPTRVVANGVVAAGAGLQPRPVANAVSECTAVGQPFRCCTGPGRGDTQWPCGPRVIVPTELPEPGQIWQLLIGLAGLGGVYRLRGRA